MKIILQRVSSASVIVESKTVANIQTGLLALVGLGKTDQENNFEIAINKILNLRIFSNNGKFDKSLVDIQGEIILVPQFTLFADTSKGRRPEFFEAMAPIQAKDLFEKFKSQFEKIYPKKVQAGVFGADMKVSLLNDGPVTISLEF